MFYSGLPEFIRLDLNISQMRQSFLSIRLLWRVEVSIPIRTPAWDSHISIPNGYDRNEKVSIVLSVPLAIARVLSCRAIYVFCLRHIIINTFYFAREKFDSKTL